MRTVRITLAALAVVIAFAVAAGAASAANFNFTGGMSNNNAGAPADMTLDYSSSAPQTLTRLDVQLPPGVMHDPSVSSACSLDAFKTDTCPSASAVGKVATKFAVRDILVVVPGTAYRLADPNGDADISYGIVLRPPLSNLGVVGKLLMRDRVSFTNGGGIRHSITGAPTSVPVGGANLPVRLAQLTLQFAGSNAAGNQVYNSTSCAKTSFTATGTFSDGSSAPRSTSYAPVNCAALTSTAAGGFKLGDPGAQKTSFAVLLSGPSKRAPAGVTHEYHRASMTADVSELGDWDLADLGTLPGCALAEAQRDACPTESQIGTITTGVEGFPAALKGTLYNSFPRGPKPTAVVRLGRGAYLNFTAEFVDGKAGAVLRLDGLPQLPLTDLTVDVTRALLRNKPAGCSGREARFAVLGHNGGQTNTTAKYPPAACAPIVTTTDADDDGDGWADDELRAEHFQMPVSVKDSGGGVDQASLRCDLASPVAGAFPKGKIKVINNGSGGIACDVDEASGPLTVIFSATSLNGGVATVKRSFTVDSAPPVVELAAGEGAVFDSDSFDYLFEVTDDTLTNRQSVITGDCSIDGGQAAAAKIVTDRDTGRSKGFCAFVDVPDGEHTLTVTATDKVGHSTTAVRTATVDSKPPQI